MDEPLHEKEMEYVARDRINELYQTAAELRASRRPARGRVGLLTRTRWSIGRRLISLGTALAGGHA